MKNLFFLIVLFAGAQASAQAFVTRDIKSFGAKGNGGTNDHDAFLKAADFFNRRGGHGKLIISKGLYLIGKQKTNGNQTDQPLYEGIDLLRFTGVVDLTVEGQGSPVIRYRRALLYGSFDPVTRAAPSNSRDFYKINYAASVGNAVVLTACRNIKISGLELDGNSTSLKLGGIYGDVGRQLHHIGLFIQNSTEVTVSGVKAHHFGLDGMMIANPTADSAKKDMVMLSKCLFEYNGRQGLSWIGGNELTVVDCGFNRTGKGALFSPPGAGLDIEAETGKIRNGKFVRCQFIDNTGCGMVADSGPSADCTFTDCTFWGISTWSVWVTKPSFTFTGCRFYGSIVHGFDANNDSEATKFLSCHFEDKPYNGKEPFGGYLIEENFARRMRFENCTLLAHKKKVAWFGFTADWKPEEKYQLIDCKLEYDGNALSETDFLGIFYNVRFVNTTLNATHPQAEKKGYWWAGIGEASNISNGGNNAWRVGKKERKF